MGTRTRGRCIDLCVWRHDERAHQTCSVAAYIPRAAPYSLTDPSITTVVTPVRASGACNVELPRQALKAKGLTEMMLWMFQTAADWPALVRATLAPGLVWPRVILETYRSLIMSMAEERQPASRGVTVIFPVPTTSQDQPAVEGSAQSDTSMYAAMDNEELAEALAFYETQVAYHLAWQDMHTAGPDGLSLADSMPATTTKQMMWAEHLPAVGQSAATTRTFHNEDVVKVALLSGDRNPLHLDPEAWVGTPFTGNVVHGALTASLFSQLMGMEFPGPGAVYLSQTLKFQAPVYIGETVSAKVTVMQVRTDKRIIMLETRAEVTRDGLPVTVLEGEAVVKLLVKSPQGDLAS